MGRGKIKKMFEIIQKIIDSAWPFALGACGGVCDIYLSVKSGKSFTFTMILLQIFTSAFFGLIAFYIADGAGLTESWLGASAGVGGMLGTRCISIAEAWLTKRL